MRGARQKDTCSEPSTTARISTTQGQIQPTPPTAPPHLFLAAAAQPRLCTFIALDAAHTHATRADATPQKLNTRMRTHACNMRRRMTMLHAHRHKQADHHPHVHTTIGHASLECSACRCVLPPLRRPPAGPQPATQSEQQLRNSQGQHVVHSMHSSPMSANSQHVLTRARKSQHTGYKRTRCQHTHHHDGVKQTSPQPNNPGRQHTHLKVTRLPACTRHPPLLTCTVTSAASATHTMYGWLAVLLSPALAPKGHSTHNTGAVCQPTVP